MKQIKYLIKIKGFLLLFTLIIFTLMSKEQPNNPLHGIKLATMLEQLYLEYGWEELGDILNINALKNNPTYKSSLKFLRTTPWARAKVEKLYLKTMID